jgi:hypothetical protein
MTEDSPTKSYGNINLVTGGLMTRIGVDDSSSLILSIWNNLGPSTHWLVDGFGLLSTWGDFWAKRKLHRYHPVYKHRNPSMEFMAKLDRADMPESEKTKLLEKMTVTWMEMEQSIAIPKARLVSRTSGTSPSNEPSDKDTSHSARESWTGYRYCLPSALMPQLRQWEEWAQSERWRMTPVSLA